MVAIETKIPQKILADHAGYGENAAMATRARQRTIRKAASARDYRFRSWAIYQVFLPCVMICVWWPIGIFEGVDFSFEKTFIPADVLLLAAFLLFAIAIDGLVEKSLLEDYTEAQKKLSGTALLSGGFAVLYVLLYGITRHHGLKYDFPVTSDTPVDQKIWFCAAFSVVAGGMGIAFSVYSFIKIHNILLAEELKDLNEVKSAT